MKIDNIYMYFEKLTRYKLVFSQGMSKSYDFWPAATFTCYNLYKAVNGNNSAQNFSKVNFFYKLHVTNKLEIGMNLTNGLPITTYSTTVDAGNCST